LQVGCTALHRAASAGQSDICEFLLEEGADIEATDRMGQTPLMHATICENRQVALLLVRHGADVDAEDKDKYTVLGHASEQFRPILIDAARAMLEG
jgi:26S proteasome non-ATPase regulatory subunit 10